MKSAYEIAMSRLEKGEPTQHLTDAKKAEIAEVGSIYRARIAERKLFLEEQIRKAAGDPVALDQLRKQLASEISRLEDECSEKKEKIRAAT